MCDKLTADITANQWRDWISPDIRPVALCPGLPAPVDAGVG
jgi:hypothetical protein